MSSIKVDIAPTILDWLITSLEGIDEKSRSCLYMWQSKGKQPTYAQIEAIAGKIHIPLGYFFLKAPPKEELPILEFRTVDSAGAAGVSRNLLDTYYQMSSIQNWMRDYLVEQGSARLPFVGSCKGEKRIIQIATIIRKVAQLKEDWYLSAKSVSDSFALLRAHFEPIGILVLKNGIVGQNTHRTLDVNEFRAFTLLDEVVPLIFINSKDSESGQLFSLVHEIAHIWLGMNSLYNSSMGLVSNVSSLETLCNAVAAELLVPMKSFMDSWRQHSQFASYDDKIDRIAKYYKCGQAVVARRAFDNKYINSNEYHNIINYLTASYKKNKLKRSGGDYYTTAKSRFGVPLITALDNSVKEGRTSYTEAFRLTKTNRATFANLVSEIRE